MAPAGSTPRTRSARTASWTRRTRTSRSTSVAGATTATTTTGTSFRTGTLTRRGERKIARVMERIRRDGQGRDHDCLIGISGGVDSSYLTYLAKEKFGLRPLLFHVDAGWNSQEAVNNIEKLVDGLGLDLHTEVIDWEEMRDLQLAFFKAQVPHIDTPQDHAFFAGLYNFAAKHGFKYILTGANYSTECVREPLEWHYHASDLRQLQGHPPPLRHAAAEDLPDCRHLHLQGLLPLRQGRPGRQAAELRAVHQGRGDAGAGRTGSAGSRTRTSTSSRGSPGSTRATGCRRSSATTSGGCTSRA